MHASVTVGAYGHYYRDEPKYVNPLTASFRRPATRHKTDLPCNPGAIGFLSAACQALVNPPRRQRKITKAPPPVVNALRGRFFRVNAIVDTVFTIDADRASKTAVYRRLIIRLRSRCLTTDKRTAPVMMNTTADTDHSCTTSPRLVPADGGCSVSRRR